MRLLKAKSVQKSTIEDVYFDMPQEYTLTKNDLWLRKRDDCFELRYKTSSEYDDEKEYKVSKDFKEISKIIHETAGLKLNAVAYGISNKDFEKVLERSLVIPLANINTARIECILNIHEGNSYPPVEGRTTEHRFKIIVDKATLADPATERKLKYDVAKVEIIQVANATTEEQAFAALISHFKMDPELVSLARSKVVEFIYKNDKRHYAILVNSAVINFDDADMDLDAMTRPSFREDIAAFRKAFNRLHGGSQLHNGVRRTYLLFNQYYPNHGLSYAFIDDCVKTCATCQMYRVQNFAQFAAITKVVKPPVFRQSVGVDRLSISPTSQSGNSTLICIVMHYTKLLFCYPAKEYDGTSIARALLRFYALYGRFDILVSDAGSDILSKAVDEFLLYLGEVDRKVALVQRPQSSAVERSNYKILQHLGMLVANAKVKDLWDQDEYLSLVTFRINSTYNSEIGFTPFQATFAEPDGDRFKFDMTMEDKPSKFISQLHENMTLVRELTDEFQADLIQKRTASNIPRHLLNRLQPGDLVLVRNRKIFKDYKLDPDWLGPYEVISHRENDVTVVHVNTGERRVVHIEELKIFYPDAQDDAPAIEQAQKAAELDSDQIIISEILSMTGDHNRRTSLTFLVKFSDNSITTKTFDQDLFQTVQYERFIRSKLPYQPYLQPLLYSIKDFKTKYKDFCKLPLRDLPKDTVLYTFLHSFGYDWFVSLDLPDIGDKQYVIQLTSRGLNKARNKIVLYSPLFRDTYEKDESYLILYTVPSVDQDHHVLIDEEFAQQHKQVLNRLDA